MLLLKITILVNFAMIKLAAFSGYNALSYNLNSEIFSFRWAMFNLMLVSLRIDGLKIKYSIVPPFTPAS